MDWSLRGSAFTSFTRRQRLLVLVSAHLVVLALLFQFMAADHWHADVSTVRGIEGTQDHTSHCHGASASCADSAGFAGSILEASLTPAAPLARLEPALAAQAAPSQLFLSESHPPPQSL
jgi:hypothetical protein